MNALATLPETQYGGSSEVSALTTELAKMLGLVAPVTMTTDQQTLWLASAVDALSGIWANEVIEVSMQVRRTVTRPSQIVPEIANLVAEKRARASRMSVFDYPQLEGPPIVKSVMDRRGEPMSDEDTTQLNSILEHLGATARYRKDGSRYTIS